MKTKKRYIAPKATEHSYESEKGFAYSLLDLFLLGSNDAHDSDQEQWQEEDYFGDDTWTWQ